MTKTFLAEYDGKTFLPKEEVTLAPHTQVRITVETLENVAEPKSFFKLAASLKLEGPTDMSENIDAYLNKNINHDE